MKKITCKQMGGPCNTAFEGNTPDEIVQKGTMHVMEMAEKGDQGHIDAKKMMDDAQNNPEMAKVWFDQLMKDFSAQPEM